jgi:hypothetical protein
MGSKVILTILKHPKFKQLQSQEFIFKEYNDIPWFYPLVNSVVGILSQELTARGMKNVHPNLLLQKFIRQIRYQRENRRKLLKLTM